VRLTLRHWMSASTAFSAGMFPCMSAMMGVCVLLSRRSREASSYQDQLQQSDGLLPRRGGCGPQQFTGAGKLGTFFVDGCVARLDIVVWGRVCPKSNRSVSAKSADTPFTVSQMYAASAA